MEKITAMWKMELNVECPHCLKDVDLLDSPEFFDDLPNDFSIFDLKKQIVWCPECNESFVCDFTF